MKNKTAIYLIITLLVAIGLAIGLSFLNKESSGPGEFDDLALCLKEKGVSFYGAFWCPHCRDQKKLFGNSAKLLPYVECSNANGSAQLPFCTEKQIKSYPTWEFADGSRESRVFSPQELAEKTSCLIDSQTSTSTNTK